MMSLLSPEFPPIRSKRIKSGSLSERDSAARIVRCGNELVGVGQILGAGEEVSELGINDAAASFDPYGANGLSVIAQPSRARNSRLQFWCFSITAASSFGSDVPRASGGGLIGIGAVSPCELPGKALLTMGTSFPPKIGFSVSR